MLLKIIKLNTTEDILKSLLLLIKTKLIQKKEEQEMEEEMEVLQL